MANKKDLKNSIAAGMTGGLDSLIQPTAPFQEPGQPKKEKAVLQLCDKSEYSHTPENAGNTQRGNP